MIYILRSYYERIYDLLYIVIVTTNQFIPSLKKVNRKVLIIFIIVKKIIRLPPIRAPSKVEFDIHIIIN